MNIVTLRRNAHIQHHILKTADLQC